MRAREMFIRHALVEGEWTTHHRFVDENRRFLDEVRAMGDRVRRWTSSTTRRCLRSTTGGSDRMSCRLATSISGGSATAHASPDLLRLTLDALLDGAARADHHRPSQTRGARETSSFP